MKAAYLDPRTLTESASEELPGRKPRRRALSARVERELNARLDSARMLRLVPESLALELVDILATRKGWSEEEQAWRLRLLFDRRRRNATERQLASRAMQALAQGTDLCELQLRESEEFRVDLQDLDNWYYQFKVSLERAASNVYGQPRQLSFFDGTHAKSEIEAQLGGRSPAERYCSALNTMAMGDHNACEFAQEVHLEVLHSEDCARETELL